MKKQFIITLCALIAVVILFFFGRTVAIKSKLDTTNQLTTKVFNINQFITESKQKFTASQAVNLGTLENNITRGDVLHQQIIAYSQLANFWKDSIRSFESYAFYNAAAAKLDKSEKSLTFAAQLFLDNLRGETDEAKLNWKAEQAIALFEKALEINPDNENLKIGLASCYIFGKGRIGGPAETMKGVSQLLEVVRKDSSNMKAQLVLGIGGYVSGQYDKAIERLLKVVKAEPDNLEAIAFLADTYSARGDKKDAIKWYLISKRMANDPHYSQEVDERIKQLR